LGKGSTLHQAYTASLNHAEHGGQGLSGGGTGYLTPKTPTYQHHCLAHVLSNEDTGTATADTEVWGGPLSGGDFVMAAVNRGGSNSAPIRLNWTMLELSPNVSQLIDSIDFSESVHKSIHYSTIDILFVCLFQSNSTALLSACLPACLPVCLQVTAASMFDVRDLWNKTVLLRGQAGGFVTTVPTHDIAMFRLVRTVL
jgi:hypothetical protein